MAIPVHIDDFHFDTAEVLSKLYAAFPVPYILLVEDLSGPIRWDMTGLPDRRSQACFETLIWLAEHGLMRYRSVEPRSIGVEGAVLSQQGFVLLSGQLVWHTGETASRIQALREARLARAYADLRTIIEDLLTANCHWAAPPLRRALSKATPLSVSEE